MAYGSLPPVVPPLPPPAAGAAAAAAQTEGGRQVQGPAGERPGYRGHLETRGVAPLVRDHTCDSSTNRQNTQISIPALHGRNL